MLDRIFLRQGSRESYWLGILGGSNFDDGQSVAVDTSGNVYTLGCSPFATSLQIAKYNSSGVLQWQRDLGSVASSFGGIAVDNSGNVYVCGGNSRFYIAKYNTSGTIQWQRSLTPSSGSCQATSIAVDSSGNVHVCGVFVATLSNSVQIVKYNTSGTIQWQRSFVSYPSDGYGYSVAVDSSSNVYVCGTLSDSSSSGILVSKYDSSGANLWHRSASVSSPSSISGTGIAADSSGNVYITGTTNVSTGSPNFYIAKLDTSGTAQWARELGDSQQNRYSNSIAVDSSGNAYALGYETFSGGGTGFVIVKYNTSGTIQWQRRITSGTNFQEGRGITTDSNGNIYLCGYTNVSGSRDFLIAKLPGDGSLTGTYSIGSYSFTYSSVSFTAYSPSGPSSVSLDTSTSSHASATSTLTDSAGTLTSTVVQI